MSAEGKLPVQAVAVEIHEKAPACVHSHHGAILSKDPPLFTVEEPGPLPDAQPPPKDSTLMMEDEGAGDTEPQPPHPETRTGRAT